MLRNLQLKSYLEPALKRLIYARKYAQSKTSSNANICVDIIHERLSNNRISNIEAIENLPSLVLLDLSYNDITNIKKGTFKDLCCLQELYLSNNKISIIEQGSFKNLGSLRTLFLYDNEISNIEHESFENLPELADLDLSCNKIFEIEQSTFVNVTSLEYLHLSCNKISNIDESTFKNLGSLKDLDLSYNQISNIEEITFKSLHSLRYLDLSFNNITYIEESTFKNLGSLQELDLSYNQISKIEGSAFKHLHSLQDLDLSFNNITYIEESTFKNLGSLQELDLFFNKISTIRQGTFENLYSLRTLNLGHNRIQKYEDGAFLFLPNIRRVDLSGNNDMMCGCHLPAVVNYTRNTYNTFVDVKGECFTDSGEETSILKYSQCINYTLFQKNLQCEGYSGRRCKDSEMTDCPGVEPVCQYKLSRNGVTLKFEKSCSTYSNCVEAMRNNSFKPNTWTKGTSTAACCTRNVCNKNDFMGTVEEFSTKLLNISQKSVYSKEDIVLAVNFLEEMMSLPPCASPNTTLFKVLFISNNIINVPEKNLVEVEQSHGIVSRILGIIEVIPEMFSLEEQELTVLYSNLGIGATKVEKDTFNGVIYSVSYGTNETEARNEIYNDPNSLEEDMMDYISLPKSNTNFNNQTTTKVDSRIIAANIPNVNITNLDEPVTISFNVIDQEVTNPQCVYWDESSGQKPRWSTEGCNTSHDEPGKTVVCSCNHLTSFAVLMNVDQRSERIEGNAKNSQYLSIISNIGCIISFVCLILTVIIHAYFKNLWKLIASKILVNLCSSLAATYLTFLVGFQAYITERTAVCKAVAALLHYFLLTSFLWMIVEAIHIYRGLFVFKTIRSSFIKKSSILVWSLPAVIVVITLAIRNTKNYIKIEQGCWLDKTAFYSAFLAPVAIILLFNITMFFVVMWHLNSMQNDKKSVHNTKKRRVFGIVGLCFLLGLPWVLAFFAFDEAAEVFHLLFNIFNTLQGMFIFVCYCIYKKDTRDVICLFVRKRKEWRQVQENIRSSVSDYGMGVAVEVKDVWNTHRDQNKIKGTQSEVKLGPDTKADETKDSRNVAVEESTSSVYDIHRNADETKGSRNDMGTTKEPGSNAAVTSMPNYAVVVLCVLGALKHFFL
ncbi:adhesion G-protein coupled receptor G6-like [Octopus vulgaris]|uniref:Adhesion G-protein coupled receptor G6-like n=1 Tax=Octopus vulgaris TaxID=6645 RepID=A0AA36FLM9_OCTVU|nr:adhesion G-protein coupled receptor G6-like [Octopus vulgaris]